MVTEYAGDDARGAYGARLDPRRPVPARARRARPRRRRPRARAGSCPAPARHLREAAVSEPALPLCPIASYRTRFLDWTSSMNNLNSGPVTTRREGGILEVTLDRPKANAIDLATSRLMGDVFAGFRDDPELRVAILRTASDKFFSAGFDLKAAAGGDAVDGDYGVGGFGGLQELPNLNKPVIAAVHGMAVGGGFEIALVLRPDLRVCGCDVRAAGDQRGHACRCCVGQAAEADPVPRGDGPAADRTLDGCRRSPSVGSRQRGARRRGRPDGARVGGRATAGSPAHRWCSPPPRRRCVPRKACRSRTRWTSSPSDSCPTVDALYDSEDHDEGFRAFAEKRPPIWKGR